jgi:hypothetical protein
MPYAKFLGWSTSNPLSTAIWQASNCREMNVTVVKAGDALVPIDGCRSPPRAAGLKAPFQVLLLW